MEWDKCIICQNVTAEGLRCPSKSHRGDEKEVYTRFSDVVLKFYELECMPVELLIPCDILHDSDSLTKLLVQNEASWHKSCHLKFATSKLNKAMSRSRRDDSESSNVASPIKTRKYNRASCKQGHCFFCDLPEDKGKALSRFETLKTSNRVKELAAKLGDRAILSKLAVKDLPAIEAEYHPQSLAKFYNRERTLNAGRSKNTSIQQLDGLALASISAYIESSIASNDGISPVFKMTDLAKWYTSELEELGGTSGSIHSTRLEERLLRTCPQLEAVKATGKYTILALKDDIKRLVRDSVTRDFDDEGLKLRKAAEIVREDIFSHPPSAWKDFSVENQKHSVPPSLKSLIHMILFGPGTLSTEAEFESSEQVVLSIAQLTSFHAVKKHSAPGTSHHTRQKETPVPVYMAMKLYGETRKKDLVDTAFKLGFSISYDRLKSIITELANQVSENYHEANVVCPPSLKYGVFTTASADNLDYNPSSTTSKSEFHGTAISLMQHPTTADEGTCRAQLPGVNEIVGKRNVRKLPSEYTVVPPVFLKFNNTFHCGPKSKGTIEIPDSSPIAEEEDWLESTMKIDDECKPWGAYHAAKSAPNERPITKIALMPIFPEPSHSMSMILHSFNVVKSAVNHLNPMQVPVISVDQPLYAIAKQIQFLKPETHGETHFVIMLGGLHIELAALRAVGHWLEDSGWVNVLVQAEITTQGKADAMIKATHITRTRYAHQVTLCALYSSKRKAYNVYRETCDEECQLVFKDWDEERCKLYPQHKFWSLVMHLESIILQFVRAIRQADFDKYIEAMIRLLPWFFALDHTHYARWLSVHVRDMVNLEHDHPEIAKKFKSGAFVATKSKRKFSNIALDHAHEQVNAVLKGDGGIVGLTENSKSFNKWVLASPELYTIVQTFGTCSADPDNVVVKHHQDTNSAQSRFKKDVKCLETVIDNLGNPFLEDSPELYNLFTREVADSTVANFVQIIEKEGKQLYERFVKERLEEATLGIMEPIKLNKFPTFSKTKNSTKKVGDCKFAGLKNDCSLFGRLYIACQTRYGDLDEFFKHENQCFPPSLSVSGEIRVCQSKSDLIQCILSSSEEATVSTLPPVNAILVDAAAIVHMLQPRGAQTFQDYVDDVYLPYIFSLPAKRLDIIWDLYTKDSLKNFVHTKRGSGRRIRVMSSTKIPHSWQSFLRDSENKTELFKYLGKHTIQACKTTDKEVYSTLHSNVITSVQREDMDSLCPCTHEEADVRLIVHAADAAARGCSKIMIRTVDTDVLVLAVCFVSQIQNLEELWVSIGTGKHQRIVAAHKISSALGPERSAALPIFHAFTGCDTVSQFSGKGKKTAWEAWKAFPETTSGFLSMARNEVSEVMPIIQKFVVVMYDRSSQLDSVNECRKSLFTKKGRQMEAIPPTLDALYLHVKRAAYQGGCVWSNAANPRPEIQSPAEYGWRKDADEWQPVWMTLPQASESMSALVRCGCKLGCSSHCKCRKVQLKCTALCNCGGECSSDYK